MGWALPSLSPMACSLYYTKMACYLRRPFNKLGWKVAFALNYFIALVYAGFTVGGIFFSIQRIVQQVCPLRHHQPKILRWTFLLATSAVLCKGAERPVLLHQEFSRSEVCVLQPGPLSLARAACMLVIQRVQ